jgi:hypothetical protein
MSSVDLCSSGILLSIRFSFPDNGVPHTYHLYSFQANTEFLDFEIEDDEVLKGVLIWIDRYAS